MSNKYKQRPLAASLKRGVSPQQARVQMLAGGLAQIATHLVACGLGPVNLGKLARHMLKLRANKKISGAQTADKP